MKLLDDYYLFIYSFIYLFIYFWFRFEAYQSRGSDDEEDEERPFGGQVFVHGKDDPLGKCANQFT